MARKRYSDEDALKILREIDVHLCDELDVVNSCHTAPSQPLFAKKRKSMPSPPR
jgi:hypothetical protein